MSTHIYPEGMAQLFAGSMLQAILYPTVDLVDPEVKVVQDHLVLNILCPKSKGDYDIESILLVAGGEPLVRIHQSFHVTDDGKEYVLCIPIYL